MQNDRVIRVVVELWPGGNESRRMVIGQAAIANVTPHDDPADYIAVVTDSVAERGAPRVVLEHERGDGWAPLVSRALALPGMAQPEQEFLEAAEVMLERLRAGVARLRDDVELASDCDERCRREIAQIAEDFRAAGDLKAETRLRALLA